MPHTSIDTEAALDQVGLARVGLRWKLYIWPSLWWVWIPLAARLTPANRQITG